MIRVLMIRHFLVGTMHRNPASWIIVGVFYPMPVVQSAISFGNADSEMKARGYRLRTLRESRPAAPAKRPSAIRSERAYGSALRSGVIAC